MTTTGSRTTHGHRAFLVDGKALRLRETFELKDLDGRVLVTIRKKMLSLRDTMTIERDDQPLATVKRKRLSLLRNHYRVELVDGTELDVSGKILDREFAIEYDGELLAADLAALADSARHLRGQHRPRGRGTAAADRGRGVRDPARGAGARRGLTPAERPRGRSDALPGRRRGYGRSRPRTRSRSTGKSARVLATLAGSRSTVSTSSSGPASASTSPHGSTTTL